MDETNHNFPSNSLMSTTAPGMIVVPTENDCIFGRGRTVSNHPGNVRLHGYIEAHHEEYEAATTNAQKSEILERIYQTIIMPSSVSSESGRVQQHGSILVTRFIRTEQSGACFVATHKEAKEKIRHALRYFLNCKHKRQGEEEEETQRQERDESDRNRKSPKRTTKFASDMEEERRRRSGSRDRVHNSFSAGAEMEYMLRLVSQQDLPDLEDVALLFLLEQSREPCAKL